MDRQPVPFVWKCGLSVGVIVGMLFASGVQADATTGFVLLNERPAKEDKPRFLSTNAWSCGFGIRVFSDEGRTFDRVTKFEAEMRSSLGSRLDGHTIRLKSYQVYFNEAAYRSDVVDSVVAGSMGAVTSGKRRIAPKCSQQETPNGWFSPAELTNDYPPFIIEIEAVLDDKLLSIRSVYSPSIALTVPPTLLSSKVRTNFADDTAGPEVEKAMNKANAEFIGQLTRTLLPSEP